MTKGRILYFIATSMFAVSAQGHAESSAVATDILIKIHKNGSARILVELNLPNFKFEGNKNEEAKTKQRKAIEKLQTTVLDRTSAITTSKRDY